MRIRTCSCPSCCGYSPRCPECYGTGYVLVCEPVPGVFVDTDGATVDCVDLAEVARHPEEC